MDGGPLDLEGRRRGEMKAEEGAGGAPAAATFFEQAQGSPTFPGPASLPGLTEAPPLKRKEL